MNFRFIAKVLGQLQIILALSMVFSLIWSLVLHDGDHRALLEAMAVTGGVGIVLWFVGRRASEEFYRREAFAVVGLGWTLSVLMGSLPFLFSGMLGPADAIFESASGLTCTGSTVVTDINAHLSAERVAEVNASLGLGESPATLRRGVMFWRSFSHWLGGMGIVVLLLALLPAVGAGSKFLFQSEISGQAEGIKPRIRQTAMRLWIIYMGLSVVIFGTLWVLGMSIYDALCHTFATIATAGFSTENASVGAFNSVKIEIALIVFMFLGATSFNLHYQVLHGHWRAWLRDREWRLFALIIIVSIGLITLDLSVRGPDPEAGITDNLRASAFTVMSIGTTTGFTTEDFDLWPASSKMLLLTLMLMGGCAGSTSGGLKIIRVILLFKIAGYQLRHMFNPRRVETLRVGGRAVDDELRTMTLVYLLVFMMIIIGATLLVSLTVDERHSDLDLVTAGSAVFATFNNIGPGLLDVGPTETFGHLHGFAKIVLAMCMILGRLELWAILCLFAPGFWWARKAR